MTIRRTRFAPLHAPRRQRGAATLAVTLLLLAALTLAVAYANRHLLVMQKAAANQLRSAQALAAAEAGVDWALALLAGHAALGDDCTPAAGGTPLRERALRLNATSGEVLPRTWARAGVEQPLRMACIVADDGAWRCHCPAGGALALALPAASDRTARPAFSVAFTPLPRAGSVRLTAVGCDHATDACLAGTGSADGGAVARVQVALALLPALATPPAAALTVRGNVGADAALALYATDPSTGGLALHAGGAVALGPAVRLQSAPGTPAAAARIERDPTLAALDGDALFATVFGLDKPRWRDQPGVQTLACDSACDAEFAAVAAGPAGPTLLRVAGDLHLATPISVGSPERPVVLVVEGQLRLAAGSIVHGLVYTTAPTWHAAGGGLVRGAVVAEGDLLGDGAFAVFHDAAVLTRLHRAAGQFVPVPGSWRDD